jgi:hypothetical protein
MTWQQLRIAQIRELLSQGLIEEKYALRLSLEIQEIEGMALEVEGE